MTEKQETISIETLKNRVFDIIDSAGVMHPDSQKKAWKQELLHIMNLCLDGQRVDMPEEEPQEAPQE